MPDDLHRKNPPVESAAGGTQAPDSAGGNSAGCGAEHGFRERTSASRADSRDTRPDRATRFIETTRGILSYSELAPLLADRVTAAELAIVEDECFATQALDETVILELHRRIVGDLVPEWAGRWRDIAVTVGKLAPPPPAQVPILMRDYALDLQARWRDATSGDPHLLLEFLAFAEGRFLAIHPFRDFNGRTIRLFLVELLRRLDLPRVELAPEAEDARRSYFSALEAADRKDWQPLIEIWKERFAQTH